jgi:hypothetical protein
MEGKKITSTGRDNTLHTEPTAPAEGSYAQADFEGSGGLDSRVQVVREPYSNGRSITGALVDYYTSMLPHAH